MLKLDRISKSYKVGVFGGKELPAVRDVSFDVAAGELVSLIGESGSGKTTIGKLILRLSSLSGGTITLDGSDISGFKGQRLRAYYRDVQGVFQDPFSCYNPVFKVDRVFAMIKDEYFGEVDGPAWRRKVDTSLEAVRLDPGQVLGKYPHQLSGGQLQRLLIGRALLLDIKLLVADEIISKVLLASVPQLNKKWQPLEVDPETLDGGTAVDGEQPTLVEVEDGHFVAAAQPEGHG